MKCLLLLLLAITCGALGKEVAQKLDAYDRSASSQVVDWIEAQKQQMPCGFPGLGVGPLSPAKLSHRNFLIDLGGMDLEGEIDDFILYGLDNFDVVQFRINLVTSRVTFKFHWHKVHFDTNYKMLLKQSSANGMKLTRKGGAKFAITDFIVSGVAKYSIIGKLRLKEFKLLATVGGVQSEIENLSNIGIINKKLNAIIEEWILLAFNDHGDEMQELSNKLVVPMANSMIGDRTLADLIGAIAGGGGGGGDGEGGTEKEECIPPTL